jgi:hypothetical protein
MRLKEKQAPFFPKTVNQLFFSRVKIKYAAKGVEQMLFLKNSYRHRSGINAFFWRGQ